MITPYLRRRMAAGLLAGPTAADPGDFPAGLPWNFRLSSNGTQLVLRTGLRVMLGALCERANTRTNRGTKTA